MITVLLVDFARLLALDVHGAARVGVQRHLVAVGALIDRLEDVDLAVVGPVGRVGQPERGPGAAAVGRVADVEDEETLVVGRLGLDADRETASRGIGVRLGTDGGVNAEDSSVGRSIGEVLISVSEFDRQWCGYNMGDAQAFQPAPWEHSERSHRLERG